MKIENLNELEDVVKLMVKHRLDFLEIDNIKISKTKHFDPEVKINNDIQSVLNDEDLFYSVKG